MISLSELPNRKDTRLDGYDYSDAGFYFVTICVKDRENLLGSVVVGANCVRPTPNVGIIVDAEIDRLSRVYSDVSVDKYVVMPNHVHLIIRIENDGRTQFAPTISRIIKQFKGSITKQLGYSIWQRSFYDHIIRNDVDYTRICQYIDENPSRWSEDEYYSRGS